MRKTLFVHIVLGVLALAPGLHPGYRARARPGNPGRAAHPDGDDARLVRHL